MTERDGRWRSIFVWQHDGGGGRVVDVERATRGDQGRKVEYGPKRAITREEHQRSILLSQNLPFCILETHLSRLNKRGIGAFLIVATGGYFVSFWPLPGISDDIVAPIGVDRLDRPQKSRAGLLYGISAYTTWGIFPLYFRLVSHVSPLVVLCHRIFWSALS